MIDEMSATPVTREDADDYAKAAHLLRFSDKYKENENGRLVVDEYATPIAPIDLLRARRIEDKKPAVWELYNIVQENAIKGGQHGLIRGNNGRFRKQKVQAVTGIQGAEKLNRSLWDLAESMVKRKRAA